MNLFSIDGFNIWMPLSALTVVPMCDVLRCFTQYQAENERRDKKTTMMQMMWLSLIAALICVMFAGLPVPIFAGVLAAVCAGNVTDFITFNLLRKITKHPVKRMVVSNLITTLVGSGLVFLIAFTDILFTHNPLAKTASEATVGWLSQSLFIWITGLVLATVINKFRNKNADI